MIKITIKDCLEYTLMAISCSLMLYGLGGIELMSIKKIYFDRITYFADTCINCNIVMFGIFSFLFISVQDSFREIKNTVNRIEENIKNGKDTG